ncbi:hypothetical protein [Rhodopseudomonas sp. BR0G17]|uniref:hypothetical protein n=1 Tax=Rhodopseudomonas sp. BR0G17 TaxID=2269368 RepID=UPI0013DF6305|nr:hypothetical protein [Rhodopseudomonas sp. BR0G17]
MRQIDATMQASAAPGPDFGAAVRDILNAEQVIQAALQTGDERELNAQSNRLLRLQSKLAKETEPGDARSACWQAAGDLSAVASLMRRAARGDEPAKSLVAAGKIEDSYRSNLASCDKALGTAKRSR